INARDQLERIPLHDAAWFGHTDVVKLLLDHKADIDARDKDGQTPLMLAAASHRTETADLLCRRGAELDLVSAILLDKTDRVAAWLKKDKAVATTNVQHQSPLHWA